MDVVMRLNGEEIKQLLPYLIIAETTSRSVWNTGRRERKMSMEFTPMEHNDIATIIQTARRWAGHGAPQEVIMESRMIILWKRLGKFCYEL